MPQREREELEVAIEARRELGEELKPEIVVLVNVVYRRRGRW